MPEFGRLNGNTDQVELDYVKREAIP